MSTEAEVLSHFKDGSEEVEQITAKLSLWTYTSDDASLKTFLRVSI